MAVTIPDITLNANSYTSINAITGIPIGSNLAIQHKEGSWVYLVESITEPNVSREGVLLTDIFGEESSKAVLAGSLEIWAIVAAPSPREARINVQLVEQGSIVDPSTSLTPSSTPPIVPETTSNKTYNTDAWFRNKVVFDTSLFHGRFTYNVPADSWYEMIDDVEQIAFISSTSVDGKLVLASGGLDEKRQLRSFRNPRYEPNRGHLYSNSAFFPTPNALAERTFGIFTSESGVGFRLRSGVLYAFRRTTIQGVTTDFEEVIALPVGTNLDKGNVYDVQFQWRGVGSYFFYINLELVHTFNLLGTLDELSLFNPAIPCAFESINLGDAANLMIGCVDVTSEGGINNGKTYGSLGTSTETGSITISGFNVPILAMRNKPTVNGLINTRDVLSLLATAYGDQRCVFRVWATRDDTAITLNNQTWQDFRDGHIEYIEYDNPNVAAPMTFDVTKANLIFSSRVDQDQSYATSALFQGRTEIYQTPRDTFIFTMHRETGQAVNVGVTFEFAEAI